MSVGRVGSRFAVLVLKLQGCGAPGVKVTGYPESNEFLVERKTGNY